MKEENKRKSIILMAIGVLTLLIVVGGATYAYFQAQTGASKNVDISATTGTTDNLTFAVGSAINIEANMENFNSANGEDQAGETTATATLTKNSTTEESGEYTYNIYLQILQNDFDYSNYTKEGADTKTFLTKEAKEKAISANELNGYTPEPELYLTVIDPEGNEVENIEGIGNYYSDKFPKDLKVEGEPTLGGYDITTLKEGVYALKSKYPIKIETEEKSPEIDNWQIRVTFKWFQDLDQQLNAGKNFQAKIIIQQEEMVAAKLYVDAAEGTLLFHDKDKTILENGAGDESYRYSGASDKVHNYICLDNKESGDCEVDGTYRIIGLFKNKDNQYEMKLIKAEGATATQLGNSEVESGAAYSLYSSNNSDHQIYYKGTNWDNLASYSWNSTDKDHILYENNTNVNMWKESNLNSRNLNEYFYNNIDETYQKKIVSHIWEVGGTSNFNNAKEVYESELGNNKLTKESNLCYTQGNGLALNQEPRLCNNDNDLLFNSNIGLMYISDYMYGTLSEYWNTKASNYNEDAIKNNNWLYLGINEWTLSRWPGYGAGARFIDYTGMTNTIGNDVYNLYCVRPSFYLKSNTEIASGDGTIGNPYRISW